MRRSFLKKASALGLGFGLLGFNTRANKTGQMKDPFVHVVFFWLKEPGNMESRKKFEFEFRTFIENVPEISSYHMGTPSDTPDRDVVDKSFTYSLLTTFKTREDYSVYADHPLHLKFIENAGDLWEKVVVYDSDMMN